MFFVEIVKTTCVTVAKETYIQLFQLVLIPSRPREKFLILCASHMQADLFYLTGR